MLKGFSHMRHLWFLAIPVMASTAYANTWTLDGGEVKLPAPAKGATIQSATVACENDTLLLSVGSGSALPQGTPAALMVDGKLFAAQADKAGRFVLPEAALDALKKGKKFSINVSAATQLEGNYSLKGSGKALDGLKANCKVVATIGFQSADSFKAGSAIEIPHTIPADKPKLWIGFAATGSGPTDYLSSGWQYGASVNPVRLTTPAKAGAYELRLSDEENGTTLFTKSVTVTEPDPATVSGPQTVVGGTRFDVSFSGPDGTINSVMLVPAGTAPSAYGGFHSSNTAGAKTATLVSPVTPGAYELRYVLTVGEPVVLAQQPITVTDAAAVTLPNLEAVAGSTITVPIAADVTPTSGDYIYIAKPGTPGDNYDGGYASIPADRNVSLKVPAQAGAWEIRYVSTDNSRYTARASATLTVK